LFILFLAFALSSVEKASPTEYPTRPIEVIVALLQAESRCPIPRHRKHLSQELKNHYGGQQAWRRTIPAILEATKAKPDGILYYVIPTP